MPKFSANLTMMFNEVDFLDRFESASKAGFKAIEYMFPYDWSMLWKPMASGRCCTTYPPANGRPEKGVSPVCLDERENSRRVWERPSRMPKRLSVRP